jgi:DHA1 family inner membrane transport protein
LTPDNTRIFWLLAFGNFVIGLGAFVVIGIISPIADGLGITKASAGGVMTAYAFAYMIASPVAVALTAQTKRRTVLSVALGLFLAGSVLSALSTSLGMLMVSRIIVAIGGALFTPVAAGVAVALAVPAQRGQVLATVFGGITLAQVIGVPLGAWLAYRFGWEFTFWAVALLAAIGLLIMLKAIPQDIKFQAATLRTILATLSQWKTTFAVAFTATFIAAIYLVFTFFGPVIEASVGGNPELRSLYLAIFGIGAVIGNYVGGRLSDKIGSFKTLAMLCVAQALTMPLFSISPWGAVPFAFLVGVWSSFGWSFMAPQQTRLVAIAPQSQALVLALNAAAIYVGIAIGSAIASGVLAHWGLMALGVAGGTGAALALLHLFASYRLSGR